MKMASLSIISLGGKEKVLSLYRFISTHNPNIMLIQELMCSSVHSFSYLDKFLKGWHFSIIDVMGNSGGLIIGWHDNITILNLCEMTSTILLQLYSEGLNQSNKLLNAYGQYLDRHPY